MELKKWKTLDEKTVFKNAWWDLRQESVELPDGTTSDWWVNHQDGGVVIFALTDDNKVIINRQYKHGIREVVTELCIGRIDGDEGGPIVEAQRELLEETGFGGGAWTSLGSYASNPTSSTAHLHVFLAKGVRKLAEQKNDVKEIIETDFVPLADFCAMLDEGSLTMHASIAAAHLALRKLGIIQYKL